MSSLSLRADALAVRLEQGARDLAGFASALTDAECQTRIPKDGRKIGVVVHHVATMYPLEIQLAQTLAGGKPVVGVTWDAVHEINARHAREHDAVTKPGVLTSQALDWPGVLLEAGKNDVAAVDDIVGDRHYLSLNVDTKPLTLEVKGATGFRAFTIPPLSVWVSPGHDPLTLRLNSALRYLRVAIDTLHLGRLMGPSPDKAQPLRLRRAYGVAAPQIARLMLTLKDEADSGNPGGWAVGEAVPAALGHLLGRHAGGGGTR